VDVDVRRVGRAVVGICLVALAVVVVVLFAVAAHKNDQITRLRQNGVDLQVTVTTCQGLLGGSGSNGAGYACKGTFTLTGHRYEENIPGDILRPPGSKVRAVAVAGAPPLLATAHDVATQRASWTAFLVPTILLIVLVLLVGALLLRRRHRRAPAPPRPAVPAS